MNLAMNLIALALFLLTTLGVYLATSESRAIRAFGVTVAVKFSVLMIYVSLHQVGAW